MSEMINRVARAIFERMEHLEPTEEGRAGWDGLPSDRHRDLYLHVAAAAIAAMREPTEAMKAAGYGGCHCAGSAWREMIDAALREELK